MEEIRIKKIYVIRCDWGVLRYCNKANNGLMVLKIRFCSLNAESGRFVRQLLLCSKIPGVWQEEHLKYNFHARHVTTCLLTSSLNGHRFHIRHVVEVGL